MQVPAEGKVMPVPVALEIYIHVVMNDEIVVTINPMLHLNRPRDDDVGVRMTKAPMVRPIDKSGSALRYRRARGFGSRRLGPRWLGSHGFGWAGFGSTGFAPTLLGKGQRQGREQREQTNPETRTRPEGGKSHGYLPSGLCVWLAFLISVTSIFDAPAGGSNVNRKSGSLVSKSQWESIEVYCGEPSSSL